MGRLQCCSPIDLKIQPLLRHRYDTFGTGRRKKAVSYLAQSAKTDLFGQVSQRATLCLCTYTMR